MFNGTPPDPPAPAALAVTVSGSTAVFLAILALRALPPTAIKAAVTAHVMINHL